MNKLFDAREKINKADEGLAVHFCERMAAVKEVAEYKAEHALPILDASREEEIIKIASERFDNEEIKAHYINFVKSNMSISRSYQAELYPAAASGIIYDTENIKRLRVNLNEDSYDIILGCSVLDCADKYFNLNRRVLILTDSGVPIKYAEAVAKKCASPFIFTVDEGEQSKSLSNYEAILHFMANNRFTRSDCVVAVGGGVVGDLAGFVASSYMRGVDFYNIPTTLLSQVDSSIGGKVAIDLGGYKNIVGAFYQPKCVIVDPELLLTLDIRQVRSGLAEALKMATTSDKELFAMFESGEFLNDIEEVILRSLLIKKGIVERDVHESGERKILNFGHTVGHAIESSSDLLHGECVALGMLYMCDEKIKNRLVSILDEIGLPSEVEIDADELYKFILRDKKASGDSITITYVNEIGNATLRKMPIENIRDYIDPVLQGEEK